MIDTNYRSIISGDLELRNYLFLWFNVFCSLSEVDLGVTVTRSCVGVWDTRSGRLLAKLADSPLGAIVTHAEITPDGRYIISSETGKFLIWNRISEQVIYRDDQPGIQQITLMDYGYKVLTVSCPNINNKAAAAAAEAAAAAGEETNRLTAITTVRSVPGKRCAAMCIEYV